MQKQIQGRLRECIKQKRSKRQHGNDKDTRLYTAVKQETQRSLRRKSGRYCLRKTVTILEQKERRALSSDILYIGFWTDIGNADPATLELLKSLKNKKIFLFGTAGFGGSEAYFQQVLGKVKESVDESNTVMGEFMCQGKMPQSVRDRYVKMKEKPDHAPNLDELIQNFDRALSHPDNEDLDRLEEIIRRDLKK